MDSQPQHGAAKGKFPYKDLLKVFVRFLKVFARFLKAFAQLRKVFDKCLWFLQGFLMLCKLP